jgi:hypothetical protein
LDSKNPSIVKENQQVEECGIMPEMGMMGGMPERPPMPASINMTAGSGEELSDMLATIMQLAGRKAPGAEEPMGAEPVIALTAEPEIGAGDPTSDMRSMIDKLNPMDGDDQGPDQGSDDVSAAHGDFDNDGDHDMDDHNAEKDEKETDEGQYDNSPADPRKPPPFGANQFANQENQPGQGDRMDGTMPKATMEQQLMADYKKFVAESQYPMDDDREKIEHLMQKYHWSYQEAMEYLHYHEDEHEPDEWDGTRFEKNHMSEGEAKTMSRAAKGHEKYGKKGMQEASNAFTQSAPYPSFKKKKPVSKEVDKPSQPIQDKPKSK